MGDSRKFKTTCKEFGCQEEIICEVENSSMTEQDAADSLCRKLEKHFNEKHPKADFKEVKVQVGNSHAVLQADGTIKNCKPVERNGNILAKWCYDCEKMLRVFEDGSTESHICSSLKNNNNTNDNLSNNNINRERERERERAKSAKIQHSPLF